MTRAARPALIARRRATPPADPVADVSKRLGDRPGFCAQVKSLSNEEEARTRAKAIRSALGVPVEVVAADLGPKGVWWRLCVGAEATEARLVAVATQWTAPGGALAPFLDPVVDGQPRFFSHLRTESATAQVPPPQASAFAGFEIVDAADAFLFGGSDAAPPLLAGSVKTESGASDVLVVAADGHRLEIDDSSGPGCAACELALRESGVRSRRAVAADDANAAPGLELLVEEETQQGIRVLSLVTGDGRAMRRLGSIMLDSAAAGVLQHGRAGFVDADADALREVAVAYTEVLAQADKACRTETRAAAFDMPSPDGGFVRVDPLREVAEPTVDPQALARMIGALDAWGDPMTASRVCAAHLARASVPATTQACVRRIRTLLDEGSVIDAVNAAGLLAEASSATRPLLAPSFLDAVETLDRDPQFKDGTPDCESSPLVEQLSGRTLEENVRLASTRARQVKNLDAVADAVFVTAARDFGPNTPVGSIVGRWLERTKITLPARHAAIEALLLPPAPAPVGAPTPVSAGAETSASGGLRSMAVPAASPGFGGKP